MKAMRVMSLLVLAGGGARWFGHAPNLPCHYLDLASHAAKPRPAFLPSSPYFLPNSGCVGRPKLGPSSSRSTWCPRSMLRLRRLRAVVPPVRLAPRPAVFNVSLRSSRFTNKHLERLGSSTTASTVCCGLLLAISSLLLHACLSPTATNHPRAPITACSCAPPCTDYHLVGCVLSAPRIAHCVCQASCGGAVAGGPLVHGDGNRDARYLSACAPARQPVLLPACPVGCLPAQPLGYVRLPSVGARVGQINPPAPHMAPHTPNAASI